MLLPESSTPYSDAFSSNEIIPVSGLTPLFMKSIFLLFSLYIAAQTYISKRLSLLMSA